MPIEPQETTDLVIGSPSLTNSRLMGIPHFSEVLGDNNNLHKRLKKLELLDQPGFQSSLKIIINYLKCHSENGKPEDGLTLNVGLDSMSTSIIENEINELISDFKMINYRIRAFLGELKLNDSDIIREGGNILDIYKAVIGKSLKKIGGKEYLDNKLRAISTDIMLRRQLATSEIREKIEEILLNP